jgi:hypothetical protein
LSIKNPDSTVMQYRITIRSSIHGPVASDAGGRIVALRVAGLERAGIGEEWWKMGRARNGRFATSALFLSGIEGSSGTLRPRGNNCPPICSRLWKNLPPQTRLTLSRLKSKIRRKLSRLRPTTWSWAATRKTVKHSWMMRQSICSMLSCLQRRCAAD